MAPRTRQKQRTRAALLKGARDVLDRGEALTVQAAADAAGISKATAYRYFPDPGSLAAEAMLDIDMPTADRILEGIAGTRARAQRVRGFYLDFTFEHEAQFRAYLAQTMRDWAARSQEARRGMRGARRVAAFELALTSERPRLGPEGLRELVQCLSTATGIEQLIALSDVCGLDRAAADRVSARVVDALLDSYGVS
ncbi:TetR/AcrR family transcriptional regulator [Halovulum dunhuangense]|uniref:TetR/AcrR family transcriptional regulator n=1 Tax=Halovulum dunhuangense TaxID=1505036 RepID=A0A849L5W4_9RHOB|nr:TetR/AcrR family transcriptional regulator [Halovulum dunhuangense]NNU81511.1 TetR/AcrR family transcriptional regulator [Halovulum dunhuangense]